MDKQFKGSQVSYDEQIKTIEAYYEALDKRYGNNSKSFSSEIIKHNERKELEVQDVSIIADVTTLLSHKISNDIAREALVNTIGLVSEHVLELWKAPK